MFWTIPSRRQSSAILSSPRRPSSTMRILSSAEKCRRVARRIFVTTSVAGSFSGTDFCLIFAPCEGYDEPEILPSSTHPICLMSADGGHHTDASGTATLLANLNYGVFVGATASAIVELTNMDVVRTGSYEARVLRLSAIGLMAIWLRADAGADKDIIYP